MKKRKGGEEKEEKDFKKHIFLWKSLKKFKNPIDRVKII